MEIISELKKDLHLIDLVLLGIGHVIGASIFVILSKIIYFGGNKTFYAIIFMCIISIIIYYCYLEIKNRYNTLINEYYVIKDNLGIYIGNISLYIIYFISIFSVVTITIEISKHYDKYISIWKNEMSYSISNLKKLINLDEQDMLDASQKLYVQSIDENSKSDMKILGGVNLGTQKQQSALILLMKSYRDRTIHIKYLTYLLEEMNGNPKPTNLCYWNNFKNS